LNILFLSELFYPNGSGAELATYLYAKLLSNAGFSVTVVTNRFSGEPEFSSSEGFAVYRLSLFENMKDVKYSILKRVDTLLSVSMRKFLRWADVVYIPRYWFSAIPLAKTLGKPVITHLHDYIPICPMANRYDVVAGGFCERQNHCSLNCIVANEKRSRGLAKVVGSVFLNATAWHCLRKFIGLSDFIICVSRAQRDIIVQNMPSLAEKVRVIYNPMPSLSPLEIQGDDFGYFGGLSHPKGFHVLLKALHCLKRKGWTPVVVNATKFPNMKEHLAHFLANLGVAVYGRLNSAEYGRVYRKNKAVIVPSIWQEPFGYVVAEAILRGRVVVASSIGGIPELADGCRGVFLIDPNDPFQLAETIEHVASLSREEASNLGAHNIEVFSSRFENGKILDDFSELLNSVIVTKNVRVGI